MDAVNGPPSLGSLRVVAGTLIGQTFQITKPVISLGREKTNDIIISDPSISRQHAQIVWNNGVWAIRKLAQQNVVAVNSREIEQSPLSDNDTIGLGTGISLIFKSNIPLGTAAATVSSPDPGVYAPTQFSSEMPPVAPPQQIYQAPIQQQRPGLPMPPSNPQSFQQPNMPPPHESTQRAPGPGLAPQPPQQQQQSFGAPSSGATLEISTNTDNERHSYPLNLPVNNIGRDPSNSIVINRPTVSSFHAQIINENGKLVFVHPHPQRGRTLNGITYEGRTYSGAEQFRQVLRRGDVFRISDENGTFVTLTYNDGTAAAQDVIPEVRPIPLGAPLITIGRLADNMVALNHPQVSGRHARLERAGDRYRIIDQNSTNHVYVNARRVSNQLLKPGDEIRIGPFKLTYTGTQLTQQDESSSIRIDALHLVKRGNKNVVLINDISLAVPPRKFVALVGGSGAGKSTLMDTLNGLRPAQDGIVYYNGQNYYQHLAAFSTQLGYVPQDDIIHRELTVDRALYYAAKLRLPDDFTKEQIRQRIDEVLEDVSMTKQRHLLVNRLSGGQRKRVSIALELLANPSVFFLDEPTSGLDPGLDRKMMMLMRKLADRGRTIVLVTHATNNINACDYVCFLSRGGYLAYFGPPNDCLRYFGKTDFAEIYSELEPTDENPDIPAQSDARFKQSQDYVKYVLEPLNQGPAGGMNRPPESTAAKPPKRGNGWRQFWLLSARYLELLKNDMGNLAILLLQAPIIGLVLYFLTFSPGSPNMQSGIFNNDVITNCPTKEQLFPPAGKTISHDCDRVENAINKPENALAIQQLVQQQQQKENEAAQQDGRQPKVITTDDILQGSIAYGSGGDAQKILFIMSFAAVLFGCINGAREIVKEAPIYRRERTVNLGIAPYMFSKLVVLGLLCLAQSFILTFAVYRAAPFQHATLFTANPFMEYFITMSLTSLAGLMLGLAISAVVPNNDRAMSIVPIALIPQVIFAGVIFSLEGTGMQILGAFFPTRWAMAALGSSAGLHGDKLGMDSFSFKGNLHAGLQASEAVPHLLLCWGMLLLTILILAVFIAYFLKRKDIRR